MPIEYEAKALDVDREAITALLNSRATLVQPRTLQRRYVYDVVPGDTSTWMRLRQTHTGATLSIKRIEHDGIDGTREWEVAVGDFDTTETMLRMLGYTPKAYQENYRTGWEATGVRFELDEWPKIPPYLEIEGESVADVRRAAEWLGIAPDSLTGMNTTKVYAHYGLDLADFPDLRFD